MHFLLLLQRSANGLVLAAAFKSDKPQQTGSSKTFSAVAPWHRVHARERAVWPPPSLQGGNSGRWALPPFLPNKSVASGPSLEARLKTLPGMD